MGRKKPSHDSAPAYITDGSPSEKPRLAAGLYHLLGETKAAQEPLYVCSKETCKEPKDCERANCDCPVCAMYVAVKRAEFYKSLDGLDVRMIEWKTRSKVPFGDLQDRPAAAWTPEERLSRAVQALDTFRDHLKKRGEEVPF